MKKISEKELVSLNNPGAKLEVLVGSPDIEYKFQ